MAQSFAEKVVQPNPADSIGLTTQEAEERLERFGANDPAPAHRHSTLTELLLLFVNPLGIILLIAAVISGFIGQLLDAGIIIAMVFVGVGVNFYQTYRSKIAIESLRARVAPTATVLRDGRWQEMDRKKLVPGDTIRLCAGDLVPSDARLLVSRDLYVQQAALTGESLPAEKEANGAEESASPDARNMVFLGTSVVSGTATAIITTTGRRTAFGDIADRLAARPEETAFDRGLRQFGNLIMRAVVFLVLFLLVVSVVHAPRSAAIVVVCRGPWLWD